jgi:cell division transport system permease protein
MMRRLITLRRIFVSGIKNFFRNSWLSIAATAVMVVALVIVLMALVLNVTTRNAIAELSKNLKVSIYLLDEAPETEVRNLQNQLITNEYVEEVVFISKDQAQQQFTDSFSGDTKLLEGLALIGGNTLPASFEVSVSDLSKMEDIGAIASKEDFKEVVESFTLGKGDARKTIERAASIQSFITKASIVSASVFAFVSMLIIFNTIRMAIFTRSDEIRTQKLLGATPSYIRGPFLVESGFYGMLAGIIAASIIYGSIRALGSKVANQTELAASYQFFTDTTIVVIMYMGAIFLGMLVGVVSSSLALNRYLKIRHW